MKRINYDGKVSKADLTQMAQTIISYLRGECPNPLVAMTERARQYFTWGAKKFYTIEAKDGSYGIQFNVTGLKHRGRVRVWYNVGMDLFDIELLRARTDVAVYECEGLDCFQLHNVLHQHIERTDDPEV